MDSDKFLQAAAFFDDLMSPLGDYAPKKRILVVDFKGPNGLDYNQSFIAWQPRGMDNDALIRSVRQEIEKAGNVVSCISEIVTNAVIIQYISSDTLAQMTKAKKSKKAAPRAATPKAAGIAD